MIVCRIGGCRRAGPLTRGMCVMHYTRWYRHGDPLTVAYVQGNDFLRLVGRLVWGALPADPTLGPCVLWTGGVNPQGYPSAGTGHAGRLPPARFFYERIHGPVAVVDGRRLDLDHLCHTCDPLCPGGPSCPHRRCVNPWHLEPVTSAENTRRGKSRLTHCVNGHEFTPENTYTRPDREYCRGCRQCKRDRDRRRTTDQRRKERVKGKSGVDVARAALAEHDTPAEA